MYVGLKKWFVLRGSEVIDVKWYFLVLKYESDVEWLKAVVGSGVGQGAYILLAFL